MTMKAEDVTDTLTLARQASGCDQAHVVHTPRLLSDNGSSHIAGDLTDWLKDRGMDHVRGAPLIPRPRARSSAGTNNTAVASACEGH
jgi:transposase InsO family protein